MLRQLRYVPSAPELRKSLKLRSKEFLRENTLAGFPYFVNPNRPTWERAIWLICTIASLIAALAIIVVIWQRFQTSPTITGIDIQTDDLIVNLPSIVLCMTSDYLEVQKLDQATASTLKQFYNWKWQEIPGPYPEATSQSLSDIYVQRTPSCSHIITNCIDKGVEKPCQDLFKKVLTPAGACCRSPALNFQKDNADMSVGFSLPPGKELNLYFQEFGDDVPLRDTPISYNLIQNIVLDIALDITEASDGLRMLTKSQRTCVFPDEGTSYNKCVYKCMQDTFLHVCKCVPWFYHNNTKKSDHCKYEQYSCLSKNVEQLRRPKCASKCYIYCAHTSFSFENIANKEETKTKIKTRWPQVRYDREVRFGWLDLIVSFGGIMGLFLGYSILTTFELIYFFTLRLYCGAVIDNKDNIEKKIKSVGEKKQKDALPVVYYDYVN